MTTFTRYLIGLYGEKFLLATLQSLFGIGTACKPVARFYGDIVLTVAFGCHVRIEVKTARPNKRGLYQFCLRKAGHADVSHADYVALILLTDMACPTVYIVPACQLTGRQLTLSATSVKFDKYRNSYASLAACRPVASLNGCTPSG